MDTVDAEDGIQIAAVVVVVVESWGLVAEHKAAQKVLRNRAVFDPSSSSIAWGKIEQKLNLS